jgi:hypothetical protein
MTTNYTVTDKGLGYARPHKMGNRLWGMTFAMAIMAFPVALVLAFVRAATVADASGPADIEDAARLGHLIAAFGFIGFGAVFASISFAIARILGRFRKGGGEVQEAAGGKVHTLRMPVTAKVLIAFMAMGMMAIFGAVALHFVAAAAVGTWSLESVARWAEVLEAVRRLGVALYLFGIAIGLGAVITVVRFQTVRLGQLTR